MKASGTGTGTGGDRPAGTKDSSHRLFIAVELPGELRNVLKDVQQELRPLVPGARWTRPESMHITVKFLGSVPSSSLEDLLHTLGDAVFGHPSSELTLDSLGGAPGLKRPRVIWLEGAAPVDLLQLKARIDSRFQTLGFTPETRPFRPHVTLARLDPRRFQPPAPPVLSDTSTEQLRGRPLSVSTLAVMESIPQKGGVRYEVLRHFRLAT